jgi:hypothetical protein
MCLDKLNLLGGVLNQLGRRRYLHCRFKFSPRSLITFFFLLKKKLVIPFHLGSAAEGVFQVDSEVSDYYRSSFLRCVKVIRKEFSEKVLRNEILEEISIGHDS